MGEADVAVSDAIGSGDLAAQVRALRVAMPFQRDGYHLRRPWTCRAA
jgi:hypothetical protein